MMRIFSVNPTLPVLAVCEICGVEIKATRQRNAAGEQWVSGEDLISAWFDHQLVNCVVNEKQREVNDEGSICG